MYKRKCPNCGIDIVYSNKYLLNRAINNNTHCKECKWIKSEKTCLEKYGSKTPLESKIVLEKIRKTCLKKYGVDNPYKSDVIQNKVKFTLIDKYGENSPSKVNWVKEKKKQYFIDTYGVNSPFSLPEIIEKSKKTKKRRYGDENYNNPEKNKQTKLEKYGDENYNNYLQGVNTCLINNGKTQVELMNEACGSKRSSLEIIVENLLNKYNLEFKTQFSLKDGKKIRFYDFNILNSNILIECDGEYWHSLPDRIENDKYKNLLAKKNDYLVIRFKENEIKKDNFENIFLNRIIEYV